LEHELQGLKDRSRVFLIEDVQHVAVAAAHRTCPSAQVLKQLSTGATLAHSFVAGVEFQALEIPAKAFLRFDDDQPEPVDHELIDQRKNVGFD